VAKALQYRWPLGMPLVKAMHTKNKLFELRVNLPNRIARLFFSVINEQCVLLHGFIKKTNKTPKEDIDLASNRLDNFIRCTL
jgi:phage-related protein